MLGVPIYNSKHKVIGALGGSYDVTALSRMLFEDLFNGQGCSMIIAQNGEIIAFEGDTSYWNLDYRDNFYKILLQMDHQRQSNGEEDQTGF